VIIALILSPFDIICETLRCSSPFGEIAVFAVYTTPYGEVKDYLFI